MTKVATQLDLEPLGPHFGALIHGLDLATATDEEIVALRAALVERKVLFLRGQRLDDDGQVRLGRRLGELTASHPVIGGVDDAHPEIYALDSTDNGFADVWHTDVTFMKRPPLGSILRPVVLPPTGGDTNWADAQLAYESLSEPVRRLVDQLTAIHDGTREFGYYLAQRGGNVWEGRQVSRLDPVEHPVVRVHPETGRRGIFVNPGFTSHIVGVFGLREPSHPGPALRPPHQARAHRAAPLASRGRGALGQPQYRSLRQP
ncbi:TauD/TfdA dioxygenase family protein [Micromonospora endophytica]|uniref:TauD/TfdA dioxygenase family protein n=1 Tax=Micromonospora endophytica TaxID=515350 RepID=UPI001C33C6D0|nr:TauD/TfdA family dioxygenase [Micromonospora endophytica]BCJ61863.1 hypothetical protein Jiend_52850 [Micromonospora endophytica]